MALPIRHEAATRPLRGGEHNLAIRLMEHLIVPTFVLGADGCVSVWNKACERLTGVLAADVIATREHWAAFYDEPRPCLADLVVLGRYSEIESFYSGYAGFGFTDFGVSVETTLRMPRLGRTLALAVDAGPVYDEGGSLLAVVQTFRDITAQKEAQYELEALAARDGLTNLHNRRSFDAILASELRRCGRNGLPLSLLMIDIDHFKQFNDHFGHIAGDTCLRQVAGAIQDSLRQSDTAARYGGEEFAVVLPGLDQDGAERVAERVRQAIRRLQIGNPKALTGIVTSSIGAATGFDADLVPSDLVAAADEALYASKHNGRDRTTLGVAQSSSLVLF